MKIYNATMHGFKKQKYYVLDDIERGCLLYFYRILLEDVMQELENGNAKGLNKKDLKGLNAMKNTLHYSDGGKMLDLTHDQLYTVIGLLYRKLYNINPAMLPFTFCFDETNCYVLNADEMRAEMDRRRKIEKNNLKKIKIKKEFEEKMRERLKNISTMFE